jgi:hypothetical protein
LQITSAPQLCVASWNIYPAKLLCALGVKGDEEKLRAASDEVDGHCLALTLLGSFLTDAYDGDIRYRTEVSARLADDVGME